MILKKKGYFKIISISFGVSFGFILLEVFARLAPATDVFPLVRPIECDLSKNINLKCLHRKKPFSEGKWSAGKFSPFNQVVIKRTNDIGQFSDINFSDFRETENDKVKIISIGDSYTEALQVENSKTFHGRLNQKKTESNKKIVSTAIGSAGMAFPNYIAYIQYLNNVLDLEEHVLVIPIISNDFDESFVKYGLKGRRAGLGQFYFDEFSDELIFTPFPSRINLTQTVIDLTLKNSALSRYLVYNLKFRDYLRNNFSLFTQKDFNKENYVGNIVESSRVDTPERYKLGKDAISLFIRNLNQLRKTKTEKKKTILLVDAERDSIYKNMALEGETFYETMRDEFIKASLENGYTVIDMKEIFRDDYSRNKIRFNSIYDGHWDEYGHKVVTDQIIHKINKLAL